MRPHAHDSYKKSFTPFIKYQPNLKEAFGSSDAVLIFQRSEYWFERYPTGFWKFFEPCEKHPLYKEDDSWAEELKISRRVFLRAFSLIGTHYKSKTAYLSQSDPFQGKMYASYYDRQTNRTHFLRNHCVVEQFLKSLWEGAKKISKLIKEKVRNCRSQKDQDGLSFVRALDISLQRSTSSCDIQQQSITDGPSQADVAIPREPSTVTSNQPLASSSCDIENSRPVPQSQSTSLPSTTDVAEEIDKNMDIAQDMLKIWNDVTTNKQTLRSDLKIKLPQALSESFDGSLELWTKFCLKVASSKFLMGEAPNSNFKAYLAWLIKPQTIADIEDKYYSLGDRQVRYHSTHVKTQQVFSRDEVEGTESWKDVCEQLCNRLGYATFRSWFKDLKFFHEETSQPTLHCPTRFMRDWVQTHYQSDLERIVKQVLPHTTNLTIGVGL